ncbi:hypothetical protein BZG21_46670, partial [Escherichia coli]|nr:hypothetical protein [Escherichia coli]
SAPGQAARQAFTDPLQDDPGQDTGDGTFYQPGSGTHPDFVTDEEAAASEEPGPEPLSPAARRLNGLMNLLEINSKRLQELLHAVQNRESGQGTEDLADGSVKVPAITPKIVVMLTLDELEGRART